MPLAKKRTDTGIASGWGSRTLRVAKAYLAFTLIEIVLAVAIGGLILAAASEFLFSMANLWAQAETEPLFDEHVESVSQFLEYTFDSTNVQKASGASASTGTQNGSGNQNQNGTDSNNTDGNTSNSSSSNRRFLTHSNDSNRSGNGVGGNNTSGGNGGSAQEPATEGISWKKIPGAQNLADEVIAFRVSGELPVFVEENGFVLEVDAYLNLDKEKGLLLTWQTDLQKNEDSEETYETLLSPWVTQLEYHYFDFEDNEWTASEEMEDDENGEPQTPDFIKLKFVHDDSREREVFILLPNGEAYVPQF